MENQRLNAENMYQDLLKRFNEIRKLNIRLLEEKRDLLLRVQEESRSEANGLFRPNSLSLMNEHCKDEGGNGGPNSENSGQLNAACKCGSTERLQELVAVNHRWQETYDNLQNKYKTLEAHLKKVEEETRDERAENEKLRELVNKLSSDLEKVAVRPHFMKQRSQAASSYNTDDIEALKQQLLAYQEDFENERQDKEKSINEKGALKGKLQDADDKIYSLTLENRQYRQCLGQVTQQKEHLISELRRLSSSTLPFSPVHQEQIPIDERFSYALSNPDDIVPRSSSPPTPTSSRPNLRKVSDSAFMGAPAAADSYNER